jgi:hypothetical protein
MSDNTRTEKEAAVLGCPMASLHHLERSVSGERLEGRHSLGGCLASGCMAWRWAPRPANVKGKGKVEPRGYCGMVGKP